MLFITLCTGWMLKKRSRKLVVLQKCQKSKISKKSVYIPPLTPDQPPFKGGRYLQISYININSRLKGAVDRELGGEYIRICFPIFDVLGGN